MSWTIGKGPALGFLCVLLAIAADAFVSFWNTRALHETDLWVAHTYEVIAKVANVRVILKDVESNARRYLNTRDEVFLTDFRSAVRALERELAVAHDMMQDNENQKERFALFDPELKELRTIVENTASSPNEPIDPALTLRAVARVEAMRVLTAAAEGEEQDLVRLRADDASTAYHVAVAANSMALLLTVGVIMFAWRALSTEFEARRKAEELAYDEREKLLTTLTSIGDAVIVTDDRGRVAMMNTVARQLTRWNADAIGRPLEEVFNIVNESTRTTVESPVTKVLREGKIVGLANHTILIARDGTESAIDDSGAPIRDDNGNIIGVVLVFRDIAERKQAETSLRESNARFRAMAETVPGILYTVEAAGTIEFMNRWFFEYTGLDPSLGTLADLMAVVHPDDASRVQHVIETTTTSGSPQELKMRVRSADGTYRWFLHRSAVQDDTRPAKRWLGVCIDIDDLVQAEESLRAADVRKDQFLAMLAHELRNPLAPLSNALQLWHALGHDHEQMDQLREIMERQVHQMIRLIDDLLDLSRITRGKIQLRRQRVELMTLVQGAVEAIGPFIDRCGHKLTVTPPSEPILVEGDVARLVQVFGNILHNAAKYSGPNGVIDVLIDGYGEQAVVRIRDNGPGIPVDMLSKIFEMFTQVDQTLDRAHGGLGIGLTLVKTLVELHGGTVVAHSDGPGLGSEFVVSLPVLRTEAPTFQSHPVHSARIGMALPSRRVLVVDDVSASAKTLAMMLRSIGQNVEVRFDGAGALEALASSQFDVVFLDIAMPGMNGYEVARRIRQMHPSNGIALVALTGYGQEQDRREALAAGFNEHLVKPTSIEGLEQLLAGLPVARPV